MFRHTCSSLNFILGDVFFLFDLFYFTWGYKLAYLLLFYFFAYLLLVVLSRFIRFYVHEALTCQCKFIYICRSLFDIKDSIITRK